MNDADWLRKRMKPRKSGCGAAIAVLITLTLFTTGLGIVTMLIPRFVSA